MTKVFIDGREGTTGLRINDRIAARPDIEMIVLSEEERKDRECRRQALNYADVAFLCLPDPAAVEAVSLVDNDKTVIIDTSTAHRTLDGWAYGFPELSAEQRSKIETSRRIAVPGCHASGFIALVYPLVSKGIIGPDTALSCFSLTGYSGGGKKMIAQYESENRDKLLDAPRQYGLGQTHKHLKEMVKIPSLSKAPVFCPIVADFYSGMEVTVPLDGISLCSHTADDIIKVYSELYKGPIVSYDSSVGSNGFISALAFSGKDLMKISVLGNDERIALVSLYDNLGKGASGAAVECMNIVLGVKDTEGLEL